MFKKVLIAVWRKISSRKFLTAVAGLLANLGVAINDDSDPLVKVVAIAGACICAVAYMLAETMVDTVRENGKDKEG